MRTSLKNVRDTSLNTRILHLNYRLGAMWYLIQILSGFWATFSENSSFHSFFSLLQINLSWRYVSLRRKMFHWRLKNFFFYFLKNGFTKEMCFRKVICNVKLSLPRNPAFSFEKIELWYLLFLVPILVSSFVSDTYWTISTRVLEELNFPLNGLRPKYWIIQDFHQNQMSGLTVILQFMFIKNLDAGGCCRLRSLQKKLFKMKMSQFLS